MNGIVRLLTGIRKERQDGLGGESDGINFGLGRCCVSLYVDGIYSGSAYTATSFE